MHHARFSSTLPIVDVSALTDADASELEKNKASQAIDAAFRSSGFAYVKGIAWDASVEMEMGGIL